MPPLPAAYLQTMDWTAFDAQFPPAARGPWRDLPEAQWQDWVWQQQHRLRDSADFQGTIGLSAEEQAAFAACGERFHVAVTPYYAALIDPDDPRCPIRLQAIPQPAELEIAPGDLDDPLHEELQSPVAGLVHRYPDRVLLYTTHNCPVYCRHCTRKRKTGDPGSSPHPDDFAAALAYITAHTELREVVLSGGDPLSLSDARLAALLGALAAIPHIEIIRIGTRNLVTLPQRIDAALASLLGAYPQVQVMTHFNHPRECTREALQAAFLLAAAGIPVYNQSVLLRGVNDDPEVLLGLQRRLLRMKIRPYYLFHCDHAQGISHFRTSVEEGQAILRHISAQTAGTAVPHYVIDSPEGKLRISP
jgi:lysine 2,3-aminomutase